ncbi:hypothetical protein [Streptomyces sp. NBC_00878]|uniref:hypothetical protein n=1 Tax=Streptomyces sp. NBC_00878 TaxID=2975854 RepID=UPI00224DB936|nr:hypothetical protein [Streptomyces sp. NBC_00878]MCX4908063.1 hypothetical protein [Streptomyces sp. NBC_00878]
MKTRATIAKNATSPSGRVPFLVGEQAREHTEPADVRGPLTFQAINNQLIDAGIGLARLAGNNPKLKAAYTALQYVAEVIEEYAADENPTVTAAVAQFEALRRNGDENLNRFIDLATEEIKKSGDPAGFASWFLGAVESGRAEAKVKRLTEKHGLTVRRAPEPVDWVTEVVVFWDSRLVLLPYGQRMSDTLPQLRAALAEVGE